MIRIDKAHPHFMRRRVKRILRDLRAGNVHLSQAEDDLYAFVRSGELDLFIAERINRKFINAVVNRMKGGAA